ncbi:hypothetical protein [Dyadobacter fermentans]|uniref:hypothetical protein n=1 Tax=Dyadobacter fermentans TaxID=94254 RepID=UPI0033B0893F
MAASLWGVSGTFSQFLFQQQHISVEWLMSVRMLISGIVLVAISKAQKMRTHSRPGKTNATRSASSLSVFWAC